MVLRDATSRWGAWQLRADHRACVLPLARTLGAVLTEFGLDAATMPMKPMSTEQCVSEALRALRKNRSLRLPGATNRLMSALVPTALARAMMGKMIEQTLAKRVGTRTSDIQSITTQ